MRTLAELQSYIQTKFNDTSSSLQTHIQTLIGLGVNDLAAYTPWEWDEKTITRTTVASTDAYNLAIDHRLLKSVKVTVGGVDYFPKPVASRRQWDMLVSKNYNATSDFPEFYTVVRDQIVLWPKPSSSGNTITIAYYGLVGDYSTADFTDYTTGTVAITAAGTTVTGTGTTFASTMVNRYLRADSGDAFWYKISAYTSATAITLSQAYEGSTVSGSNFKIGTLPPFTRKHPEAMDVLALYILADLWEKREEFSTSGGKSGYYRGLYDVKKKELRRQMKLMYDGPSVEVITFIDETANPNLDPVNLHS